MLVSILAARHAALKELKLRYPFIEEGVLLSRLVAYCSKIVSTSVYSFKSDNARQNTTKI